MTFVVTEACIDILDKSCVNVCPVDCIYEGDRVMYINAKECIDCGACEPVCPQEAIYFDDEIPDDQVVFQQAGDVLFAAIGNPGGAKGHGRIGHDSPVLVDLLALRPRES